MAPPAAGALKALVDILNSLVSHGMTIDKIPDDADESVAKSLYRQLLLALHPDKANEDYCKHSFLTLQRAWEVYRAGRVPTYPHPEEDSEDGPADNADEDSNAGDAGSESKKGLYVDLCTFSHPRDDAPKQEGQKTPADFDRASFGELLAKVYVEVYPNITVKYYAVFLEQHKTSAHQSAANPHFHVSVKTDKQHKWKPLAERLRRVYGVYASFTTKGPGGYCAAFRYGYCPTKKKPLEDLDPHPHLSDNHPHPFKAASFPKWEGRRKRKTAGGGSGDTSGGPDGGGLQGRFSIEEFSTLVGSHSVKTVAEHLTHALEDDRVRAFCTKHRKDLAAHIATYWEIQGSKATVKEERAADERSQKSRIQILEDALSEPCACAVEGKYYACAKMVLEWQDMDGPFLSLGGGEATLEGGEATRAGGQATATVYVGYRFHKKVT
jgi:hypothetical protein